MQPALEYHVLVPSSALRKAAGKPVVHLYSNPLLMTM